MTFNEGGMRAENNDRPKGGSGRTVIPFPWNLIALVSQEQSLRRKRPRRPKCHVFVGSGAEVPMRCARNQTASGIYQ